MSIHSGNSRARFGRKSTKKAYQILQDTARLMVEAQEACVHRMRAADAEEQRRLIAAARKGATS